MVTPERKTFTVQRRRHRMTAHSYSSLVIFELLTIIVVRTINIYV